MRVLLATIACASLVGGSLPPAPALAAPKKDKFPDPCSAASNELQKSKGSVARLILGRAAIGGLLGAGARLLVDRDASSKDVLKSAIGGAIIGGFTGYLEAKKRQNADVKALAGSVYQDAAASNAEAARALRAFGQVRICRLQTAAQIKAALGRGEITEDVARSRLIGQKALLEKDVAAIEQFAADYDKALDSFRSVAGYLAESRPEDQAYVEQFGPAPKATPTLTLVTAKSAANVRSLASTSGAIVGKLAAGEKAELVATPDPAWREIRLASGQKGFVSAKLLSAPPGSQPTTRRVDLARVSEEVRTVGQPLFEGVEKRSALDSEIQLARANVESSTFEL